MEFVYHLVGSPDVIAMGMGADKKVEVLIRDAERLQIGSNLSFHAPSLRHARPQRISRVIIRGIVAILSCINHSEMASALEDNGIHVIERKHMYLHRTIVSPRRRMQEKRMSQGKPLPRQQKPLVRRYN